MNINAAYRVLPRDHACYPSSSGNLLLIGILLQIVYCLLKSLNYGGSVLILCQKLGGGRGFTNPAAAVIFTVCSSVKFLIGEGWGRKL